MIFKKTQFNIKIAKLLENVKGKKNHVTFLFVVPEAIDSYIVKTE